VSSNPGAIVRFESEVSELGPDNAIGTEFDVAVVVENVENLYGLSVKVYINETYFQYVSHTTTIPWNTTQTPVPPSPYGGILYSPIVKAADTYHADTHIIEIGYSSQTPAPSFAGSGTICIITLKVVNHPIGTGYLNITAAKFTEIKLAGYGIPPPPISYTSQDLIIKMNYRPQPLGPIVEVAQYYYKGSIPHESRINVSIINLDSYWDLVGFDLKMAFDPHTINVENVTLGDFANYYNLTYKVKSEVNNTEGTIWVVYMFDPTRTRMIPEGNGTLITLEIDANCSSPIKITQSQLAAWAHPERSEEPWRNQPYSIAIPHIKVDGKAEIISVKSYTIVENYDITIESNYCINLIDLNLVNALLGFRVYVLQGEQANTTIYIPSELMFPSESIQVYINGFKYDATITENDTYTIIYLTYDSTAQSILVMSQYIVPEFSVSLLLFTAIITSALALLIYKKSPL
jgi:hypothetical protein